MPQDAAAGASPAPARDVPDHRSPPNEPRRTRVVSPRSTTDRISIEDMMNRSRPRP